MGLLHAVFSVSLRADQIVSGTAINFLAIGITGYLFVKIYGTEGTPDNMPEIPDVHLPIGWPPVRRRGTRATQPDGLGRR